MPDAAPAEVSHDLAAQAWSPFVPFFTRPDMKKNLSGDIAHSLLSSALRGRFLELFSVASRKSVFAWREAVPTRAQVLVLDASAGHVDLPQWPPCVIWVGEQPARWMRASTWVGRLPADYTVADLIDMLDRAAVFLMDWKARQPQPAFVPVGPQALAAGMGAEAGVRYRLASWVALAAPFNGPSYLRALAMLAREAVTVQQLQEHGGLPPEQASALLVELRQRGVLRAQTAAVRPSVSQGGLAQVGVGQRRLVQRLTHWLRGAIRA